MIDRFIASFVLLLTLTVGPGAAQDKPKPLPGDEMIYKYLCAETDKLSKKFMDGAKTLGEWKEKLPRLKREYMDMLGLWPIPEKTPLMATVTGQVEAHGVVVEKVHFQSKPGLYVTANVYHPSPRMSNANPGGRKYPAIVYVCGHSGKGRDGNKTAFQDHGFWFANNGYVCIVLDTLQLGEIPGVHHGTYGRPWTHLKSYGIDPPAPPLGKGGPGGVETRAWWWSAGYTPAGVECWNGIRAIDYLLTRPDVDPDKIGVTGISGGGAATFWIAAADDRVKVAVPVSGMSDLESYVKNKVVNGHCDCMFLYNTYQWDWTTIAALVAPRPLLFANSDNDGIFPMDGNRRIIAKLRDCYRLFPKPRDESSIPAGTGAVSLIEEYVSKGGHDYRPDLRIAIFKFLNKHLKGDTTTPVEDSAKYTPLPGKDLRVFPTDADLPKDAINGRIDETFVPRVQVELPTQEKFAEWKKDLLASLQSRVLYARIDDIIPAKSGYQADFSGEPHSFLATEPGIQATWHGIRTKVDDIRARTLIVATPRNGSAGSEQDWKPYFDKDVAIPIVRVRGGLPVAWTLKSPPNYVERSHVLLGRTTDQGRVWDVIAAIRMLHLRDGKQKDLGYRVIGGGQAGILAAYAALFEPSIKEVVVIDPPKSHKEGPHFLGVLRVLDIPEALGLLAPTPLTIIGGKDAAFDRTAEIYRLAGASDKLVRK